ncbi:STAS domain-containing protein [Streptomyces anandii]|uniref:STAS domain-containing protein n=1 Tax=Streptomyces anandii TaxID=285454 RepID=UPI0036F9C417
MTDRTLTVSRHSDPAGVTVVAVTGELDHHTAPGLNQAIQDIPFGPDTPLVIDLTGLSYCDSTGITVLITAYNRAQQAGTRLLLAGLSADLMRVFRIVGLDQIFVFQPTLDAAIAAVAPPSGH